MKRLEERTRKATNAAWGIMKRTKVNTLRRRMMLMNALAKSGGLYRVEVWGWRKWKGMERTKGRFVKMAMGLNTNTPGYM